MTLFHRPPSEVAALLPKRERALAWAATAAPGRAAGGGWLVATDVRLRCTAPELDRRWVEILGASWDSPALEVKLWTPGGVESVSVHLPDAGVLPQVIRERIMQSLLVQQHVALWGTKGVRFLARRDPETDEVSWQTVVDPGVDASDPAVAQRITESLAVLRDAYGV